MKLRTLMLAMLLVGAGLVLASPAFAQDEGLPDLPGLGSAGKTTGTGVSSGGGTGGGGSAGNLPGLGRGTSTGSGRTSAPTLPRRAGTRGAAARDDAPSRLPRTGAPVLGFGLLGISFVAGGRMLIELARR